jgi:hypothetical protein
MLSHWLNKRPDAAADAPQADAPAPAMPEAGDDAALLVWIRSQRQHAQRLAAARRLTSREAMEQLTDWAREHDRGVHKILRDALARFEQRDAARARARSLIEQCRNLGQETGVATQVAALDRDWSALDPELLDEAQVREFLHLRGALAERFDMEAAHVREWLSTLHAAQGEVRRLDAAWQNLDVPLTIDSLTAAKAAHAAVVTALPLAAAYGAKSLAQAMRAADEALSTAMSRHQTEAAAEAACRAFIDGLGSLSKAEARASAEGRWESLDKPQRSAVAAGLASAFHARVMAGRKAAADEASAAAAASESRKTTLAATLQALEAALASGDSRAAGDLVPSLQSMLASIALPESVRLHAQGKLAEAEALAGWRRWGESRTRERLVKEAEDMANASLSPHARAEAVRALRARWKELAGKDAPQSLWRRFDAACTKAYQPAAEAFAKDARRREEGESARRALIEELQAAAASLPRAGDSQFEWNPYAAKIQRWQQRWRGMGPIEHTVPRRALKALEAAHTEALATLQAPLEAEWALERVRRDRLLAEAKTLAEHPPRDLVSRTRDLQARWQARVGKVSLPRKDEESLFRALRASVDQAFDKVKAAREEGEKAAAGERGAARKLIAELKAVAESGDESAVTQALATHKARWRQIGALASADSAALTRDYQAAVARLGTRQQWFASAAWRREVETVRANLPTPLPPAVGDCPTDVQTQMVDLELLLGIASPESVAGIRRLLQAQHLQNALRGGGRRQLTPSLARAALAQVSRPEIAACLGDKRVSALLAALATAPLSPA